MSGARTAEISTRGTNWDARRSNQYPEGNDCSGRRIIDQCSLCMVSMGGYYCLVIFAIFECFRRRASVAGIFFCGLVFLPVGLKLFWTKFQKWQTKKQILQQNAESFYRLSVVRRENEMNQNITPQIRSVERNQNAAAIGSMDGTRGVDEGPMFVVSTHFPPAYEQACPADLPPTYEEAVQCYDLTEEETNQTRPVNSLVVNPS